VLVTQLRRHWLMGQCSVFVQNRELFAKEPFNITTDEPFVDELKAQARVVHPRTIKPLLMRVRWSFPGLDWKSL
jgi:hypothetical protein